MAYLNILVLLLTSTFLYLGFRRISRLPLPPGPYVLPTSFPDRDIWRTFQKWHAKYGPIISLRAGLQTVIIIGDRSIAEDLLDKRGNIYSSRPTSVFLNRYLLKGLLPALLPYGAVWRLHRRLHTSLLSAKATQAYYKIQDLESKQLTYEMLFTNDFTGAFHRYTSSISFTLAYGKPLRDGEAFKKVKQIDDMLEFTVQAISLGGFLVDLIPMLDRLPGLFSKQKAKAEQVHRKLRSALIQCNNTGIQGKDWNWSQEALEREETKKLSQEQIAFSIGELYIGGTHSSLINLETFVMITILHRDAVHKAQEELDYAIGLQRLPTFDDSKELPYVNAFISELMRWRPLAPLGIPHCVSTDDEYIGYAIPANSIIIANQWQMNMDENTFDDPDSFKPERWIQNPDLPLSAFGFGRRACPGQRIARSTLFIAISRLLWAYDIRLPDQDDQLLERAANRSGQLGGAYRPSAFNACFQARSPEHLKVIEKEWALADKDSK